MQVTSVARCAPLRWRSWPGFGPASDRHLAASRLEQVDDFSSGLYVQRIAHCAPSLSPRRMAGKRDFVSHRPFLMGPGKIFRRSSLPNYFRLSWIDVPHARHDSKREAYNGTRKGFLDAHWRLNYLTIDRHICMRKSHRIGAWA